MLVGKAYMECYNKVAGIVYMNICAEYQHGKCPLEWLREELDKKWKVK